MHPLNPPQTMLLQGLFFTTQAGKPPLLYQQASLFMYFIAGLN